MKYPSAYIEYLYHFHVDRDYFECHEVLELHWKSNGMGRTSIWVGLIQIAVGFYHYRRGNTKGAFKMIKKALHILINKKDEVDSLGLDHDLLIRKLENSLLDLHGNIPYTPISLPIKNHKLMEKCLKYGKIIGTQWSDAIDNAPYEIIHKHKMRKGCTSIEH